MALPLSIKIVNDDLIQLKKFTDEQFTNKSLQRRRDAFITLLNRNFFIVKAFENENLFLLKLLKIRKNFFHDIEKCCDSHFASKCNLFSLFP